MQRWQLTTGLAGLALVGAILAPRISAYVFTPPPDTTPEIPVTPGGEGHAPVVVQGNDPVDVEPVQVEPVASPSARGHLRVSAGLDRTAILEGRGEERFLAITVSAPSDLGESWQRPVDIAVVMDVSGSMRERGKIDYAKRAAKMVADQMDDDDRYSLVTFNKRATVVFGGESVDDVSVIHRAVDRVVAQGGTNIHDGLSTGAEEVRRVLDGHNVGRVVLLSDGKATHGVTDDGALARLASEIAASGVTVSAVGLGSSYNEDLMARIADVGGGTYDFVDEPRQLAQVFEDELERSASIVARNTQVSVQLPDGVTGLEVIGWDAERTAAGWMVNLGDVYAGETRKIIAKVRVTGDDLGTMNVASVRADYSDLVDERQASSFASAKATVTQHVAVVEKSVDRKRAIAANRAYGNWYLDQSARAYARGDVEEAKALAGSGAQTLQDASAAFAAPELATESANLEQQQRNYDAYKPSSAAGRSVIKKNKEDFRDLAR